MAIARDEAAVVELAVATALAECGRVLLAVSGGLDSMTLLAAAGTLDSATRSRITVATFDHGTGPAAMRAASLVAREAARRGFPCVLGRAQAAGTREEEWRRSRWKFLDEIATRLSAAVVTGHTLDDQVETVFMRILREAGPRGLAGLYADSEIVRPFLGLQRSDIAAHAARRKVKFITDPSNADRKHLRNRVRLDLLPSIAGRNPNFPGELLALARAAADWRRSLDEIVGTVGGAASADGSLRIERASLAGHNSDSLRVLWPALAARASVVMDRRGTQRAAEFTIKGRSGGAIQLSGGVEIVMRRDHMLLRRWRPAHA